jgi:hypothetical protein
MTKYYTEEQLNKIIDKSFGTSFKEDLHEFISTLTPITLPEATEAITAPKQYVRITGPGTSMTWEGTEYWGFNKTDKFEVKEINNCGDYHVLDPDDVAWWFKPSSVELVEEPSKYGFIVDRNNQTTISAPDHTDSTPNVPTFTEEEAKLPKRSELKTIIHDGQSLQVLFYDDTIGLDSKFICSDGNTFVALTHDELALAPIPTKQPWGQAEFLEFLAKCGGFEEVEVMYGSTWNMLIAITRSTLIDEDCDSHDLETITHIKHPSVNNGEPVETSK